MIDVTTAPVVDEMALASLWVAVVEAGGAVGYPRGATMADVLPQAIEYRDRLRDGSMVAVAAYTTEGGLAGIGFLKANHHPLMTHWMWLVTLMIAPEYQGQSLGRRLVERLLKSAGSVPTIRSVRLTCRAGLGLETFYNQCGFREVGRIPGALRLADGRLRDEIHMIAAV